MTSVVLLYIGTMLVAFQIVGAIGHLASLPILYITHLITHWQEFTERFRHPKESKAPRKYYASVILLIILIIVFIVITIVFFVPVMIIYFIIGDPLLRLNKLLNQAYQKLLAPLHGQIVGGLRAALRLYGAKPDMSDANLLAKVEQMNIPFIALFGLIIITISFILSLLGW